MQERSRRRTARGDADAARYRCYPSQLTTALLADAHLRPVVVEPVTDARRAVGCADDLHVRRVHGSLLVDDAALLALTTAPRRTQLHVAFDHVRALDDHTTV